MIVGTAGHVDHGKTTLVKALTGIDTDRLPEEKKRGISLELGFAQWMLPSGRAVSVVDVPGHERLVKAMVAGAGGMQLALLVIATVWGWARLCAALALGRSTLIPCTCAVAIRMKITSNT